MRATSIRLATALAVLACGVAGAQPRPTHAFVPLDEPDAGPWTFVDIASVRAANPADFTSARYADLLVLGQEGPGDARRNVVYRIVFTCSASWVRPLTRMDLDAEGQQASPVAPVDLQTEGGLPVAADIRPLACGPLPLSRPSGAADSIAAAIAYRAQHAATAPASAPARP